MRGGIGDDTPAVRLIARLSNYIGLKLVTPSETWLNSDPDFRPLSHWAAFLTTRTHVPTDALIWGLRAHAINIESLSFWTPEHPLAFVGPGVWPVGDILDSVLLTLESARAWEGNFGLAFCIGNSFCEGISEHPGAVSLTKSGSDTMGRSEPEAETSASIRPRNAAYPEDLVAACPTDYQAGMIGPLKFDQWNGEKLLTALNLLLSTSLLLWG